MPYNCNFEGKTVQLSNKMTSSESVNDYIMRNKFMISALYKMANVLKNFEMVNSYGKWVSIFTIHISSNACIDSTVSDIIYR